MKRKAFTVSLENGIRWLSNNSIAHTLSSNRMVWQIFNMRVRYSILQAPYAFWKLLCGDVFQGCINGKQILFYDPYRSPEAYWIRFLTGRFYEHSVIMHLKHIVKKYESPTFLDIGAHYGYYTVYMAILGGPSSVVLSFEPNYEYFNVLSTNVKLNKLQNVISYRVPLSDKKGKVDLETSKRLRSIGFITERRKIRTLGATRSPSDKYLVAITFDELAQATRISPDIVKIDVHGAEGNVITGMKKTLKKHISHLYCELHSEMCDGYTARDIVETLQDVGLETFEFRGFRTQNGKFSEITEDLFLAPHNRMIYARK